MNRTNHHRKWPIGFRGCFRCGQVKKLEDFVSGGRKSRSLLKKSYICKKCGNEKTRAWFLANQDKVLEYRKKRSGRDFSLSYRWRILDRDKFTCQYCGSSAPTVRLEVDHIIPVSKGGKTEDSNLITACFDCNNGKRDKMISGGFFLK